MAEAADFLAAIRAADPDDDGPTLIYADWLDEQGQSGRAELIRVQVAAARHDPGDVAGVLALRRRARELLTPSLRAAITPANRAGVEWGPATRGLIRSATLSLRRVGHSRSVAFDFRQILTSEAITRIDLICFDAETLARLLALPEARTITHLGLLPGSDIPPMISDAWISALGLPPRLVSLKIRRWDLAGSGVAALARADWFGRLRALDLRINQIGAEGLRELDRVGVGLRSINLALNALAPRALCDLAGGRLWRDVEELDLGYNPVNAAALQALREGDGLRRLRRLVLHGAGIDDAGLETLADRGGLPELRSLLLNSNRMGDPSSRLLVRPDLFPNLGELEALVHRFGPEGIARLQQRFGVGLRINSA